MFSVYEEFQGNLSEVKRKTYTKNSIFKEHKGYSKPGKWAEMSYLFEMFYVTCGLELR